MGTVVLDTSVVLGLRDPQDAHHAAAVTAIHGSRQAGDRLVLPCSALAEVLVGASRLGVAAVNGMEEFVDAIIDVVYPIEREGARVVASYRARYPTIRLPDAFVLAVGEILKADTVFTADHRWKGIDKRVKLIA
ncbi:MAG: type II toxin-antitoxin system VapC family toxin [Candidatus Dormibacteraceae bacterium]